MAALYGKDVFSFLQAKQIHPLTFQHQQFDFVPQTFALPSQLAELHKSMQEADDQSRWCEYLCLDSFSLSLSLSLSPIRGVILPLLKTGF